MAVAILEPATGDLSGGRTSFETQSHLPKIAHANCFEVCWG
jgi:hypothetical protein